MLKILVVSPHADDEVIGCGGTIARLVQRSASVHVVVVGLGGIRLRTETTEMRMDEFRAASKVLGVQKCSVLYPEKDKQLDIIPQVDMVTKLDVILNEGYNFVLFPRPSHDYDHQVVQRACMAALRPGAHRPAPEVILMYENHCPRWAPVHDVGRLYVDITDFIDIKRRALMCYASQLRPYPRLLSVEATEQIASMRGLEIGVRFAELFHVVQITGLPGILELR